MLRSRSVRAAQLLGESVRPPWPWFRALGLFDANLAMAGLLHSIAQLGSDIGKEEHPEMAVVPLENLQTATTVS